MVVVEFETAAGEKLAIPVRSNDDDWQRPVIFRLILTGPVAAVTGTLNVLPLSKGNVC